MKSSRTSIVSIWFLGTSITKCLLFWCSSFGKLPQGKFTALEIFVAELILESFYETEVIIKKNIFIHDIKISFAALFTSGFELMSLVDETSSLSLIRLTARSFLHSCHAVAPSQICISSSKATLTEFLSESAK